MPSALSSLITSRIRDAGRITVADYIEQALYEPSLGYYAAATKRSGREGDFFTSVDLGPVFGALLADVVHEAWERMARPAAFDLVEAAAGNGRLTASLLDTLASRYRGCYDAARVRLVERSQTARAQQQVTLQAHAGHVVESAVDLPQRVSGVIFANELLDAIPPHLVVMRREGLREVYVTLREGRLETCEDEPSTPALAAYLERVGALLPLDCHGEVNLAAVEWTRQAARALEQGAQVLVDYGHEAKDLYSAARPEGTLTTFTRHVIEAGSGETPPWLREPGESDITSHVDLTAVRLAAVGEGLDHLATVDQASFLLGFDVQAVLDDPGLTENDRLRRRLALKTLLMPGGLGSTHKVLLFARALGPSPFGRGATIRRLT